MLLAGPGVVGFFTTNQSFDELSMSERRHVQCVIVRRFFGTKGLPVAGPHVAQSAPTQAIHLLAETTEAAGPGGIQYGSQ